MSVLWWLVPIGLVVCLLNVFVIIARVETQQSQHPALESTTFVSPDSVVRRISSSASDPAVKKPPPVIHGVQMHFAVGNTTNDGQDDVDEGYVNEQEEEEEKAEENEEEAEAEDEWDDQWGDDAPEALPKPGSLDEPGDKEPVMRILREAGMDDIDNETLQELPTWSEVTRLYGLKPRIYGLETCETFRNHSDPAEHFLGTAGNFNSGTNLLSELLIHNCRMTKRMEKYGAENKGIRWQVPWGKHSPPLDDEFRNTHKTKKGDNAIDADNVLPAVTIRDPYVWMQSMCRHQYGAYWPSETGHCPNLVPDERDFKEEPWLKYKHYVPIDVRYSTFNRQHDSLVHFWNEWYTEYFQAPFPRLIVRFEDLIFHAKDVTTTVCHCAGGEMTKEFIYIVDSAKKGTPGAHGSKKDRTSFVDAIIRYGKDTDRLNGFTPDDVEFARRNLNLKLMNLFGYQFDDPPQSVK